MADMTPPLCLSSQSQVMPSALVLTMSDGGDGGHDATTVFFGGFSGNASLAVTASESHGPMSSLSSAVRSTSSSTASDDKLALDWMTSSVGCNWQGVVGRSGSSSSHIALSSTIEIFSLASELPLHGRSASDRLRTSETSQKPNL